MRHHKRMQGRNGHEVGSAGQGCGLHAHGSIIVTGDERVPAIRRSTCSGDDGEFHGGGGQFRDESCRIGHQFLTGWSIQELVEDVVLHDVGHLRSLIGNTEHDHPPQFPLRPGLLECIAHHEAAHAVDYEVNLLDALKRVENFSQKLRPIADGDAGAGVVERNDGKACIPGCTLQVIEGL